MVLWVPNTLFKLDWAGSPEVAGADVFCLAMLERAARMAAVFWGGAG